jgi:hypothetical protein
LKLFQNILQSREIRFGDAMEEAISVLLDELGFKSLEKKFTTDANEDKSCDQYFITPDETAYYLVEQKIRDDHDSSKKVGQFKNFHDKLTHLHGIHGERLSGAMYFVDPSLTKNRNYYLQEIEKLKQELGIKVHLFYGGELFEHLGIQATWEFLNEGLREWRKQVPETIPLDLDATPITSWRSLRRVEAGTWHKLITTDELWKEGLIKALFPKGHILCLLHCHLMKQGGQLVRVRGTRITNREVAFVLAKKLKTEYGLNPEQLFGFQS